MDGDVVDIDRILGIIIAAETLAALDRSQETAQDYADSCELPEPQQDSVIIDSGGNDPKAWNEEATR